jgi:hypothetical protein
MQRLLLFFFLTFSLLGKAQSDSIVKVALIVTVDTSGKLLSSVFQPDSSTTSDEKWIKIAKRQASHLKFPKRQDEHIGTILFKFKLTDLDSDNIPANQPIPNEETLKEKILSESKEGGKLDFFTEIKGHEFDGIEVKPRLYSTRLGMALYKWGKANYELGVSTVEQAYEIWKEFKGRPMNEREREYIKLGFNRELEK